MPELQMAAEMSRAVAALDPELPVHQAGSLEQRLASVFLPSRTAASALGAFGLLALLLAATGIHGLVSYVVARRAREIGIRMAVGAGPVHVLRVVLGRMAVLLLAGAAAGLVLAAGAPRASHRSGLGAASGVIGPDARNTVASELGRTSHHPFTGAYDATGAMTVRLAGVAPTTAFHGMLRSNVASRAPRCVARPSR